jgi:hypothetical protein
MLASDTYNMNAVLKMNIPELILWLTDTAKLQEAHPFHGSNWPDWVPGPKRFRQHAEALTIGMKAAENKDREKMKVRDLEHAEALVSISMNANYIVMRAHHEKDESLLHDAGYEEKEKTKKTHVQPTLRNRPMVIKVRNGPDPASLTVRFEKDPAAGAYELQICRGEPTGEQSWGDSLINKNCRAIVNNLTLATWVYVRGRSLGNNQAGPWSVPVGIIIV